MTFGIQTMTFGMDFSLQTMTFGMDFHIIDDFHLYKS